MAEFQSLRRFYLSKRIAARCLGDYALMSLWHGKQAAQSAGTLFPADFPNKAELEKLGYQGAEDLVGADELELREWVGLTSNEAAAVLAAAANL